jgi:hypothetical protein
MYFKLSPSWPRTLRNDKDSLSVSLSSDRSERGDGESNGAGEYVVMTSSKTVASGGDANESPLSWIARL